MFTFICLFLTSIILRCLTCVSLAPPPPCVFKPTFPPPGPLPDVSSPVLSAPIGSFWITLLWFCLESACFQIDSTYKLREYMFEFTNLSVDYPTGLLPSWFLANGSLLLLLVVSPHQRWCHKTTCNFHIFRIKVGRLVDTKLVLVSVSSEFNRHTTWGWHQRSRPILNLWINVAISNTICDDSIR